MILFEKYKKMQIPVKFYLVMEDQTKFNLDNSWLHIRDNQVKISFLILSCFKEWKVFKICNF